MTKAYPAATPPDRVKNAPKEFGGRPVVDLEDSGKPMLSGSLSSNGAEFGNIWHDATVARFKQVTTQKRKIKNDFTIPEDLRHREQPGLARQVRKDRFRELFEPSHPDRLNAFQKPDASATALINYVFGDRLFDADGRERLMFRFNPHLKRWCMWELHLDPSYGTDRAAKLIWICSEEPVKTGPGKFKIPSDYDGNVELLHLLPHIGEYKEIELWELELIEGTDRVKYGVNAVEEYLHSFERKEIQAHEKKMSTLDEQMLDEVWNLAQDIANQQAGSGQRMRNYGYAQDRYLTGIGYERKEIAPNVVIRRRRSREEIDAIRNEEKLAELNVMVAKMREELLAAGWFVLRSLGDEEVLSPPTKERDDILAYRRELKMNDAIRAARAVQSKDHTDLPSILRRLHAVERGE